MSCMGNTFVYKEFLLVIHMSKMTVPNIKLFQHPKNSDITLVIGKSFFRIDGMTIKNPSLGAQVL